MEQTTNLFSVIYSRFILRDLFGKIVPGSLVLLTVGWYFNISIDYNFFANLSFWVWLTYSGIAWIMGFAIQSIGELFLGKFSWGYRYFPKWKEKSKVKKAELEREDWYDIYFVQFLTKDLTENERNQDERLVVIKEACGNGFIASFLILLLYWLHSGAILLDSVSALLIVLIIALWRMHIQHVHRQYNVIQKFLEARKKSQLNQKST